MNLALRSRLPLALYSALTVVTWAWLYRPYYAGINVGTYSTAAQVFAFVSFWGNFLVLSGSYLVFVIAVGILTQASRNLGAAIIAISGTIVTAWLFVDSRVYSTLGLHANRFLVEALSQPDAFSHIGVDPSSVVQSSWPLVVFAAPHLLFPVMRQFGSETAWKARGVLIFVLLAASGLLADRLAYGYFYFKGASFVFDLKAAAPIYPTFHPYTTNLVFERMLGHQEKGGFMDRLSADASSKDFQYAGEFKYPVSRIEDAKALRPYNVIFIVAESLRSHDFSPETAPRISRFSERAILGANHYSSSNCTHFGVFSLLYGLNPWYFGEARSKKAFPIGLSALVKNDYKLYATLSRTMQWYDLDRLVFNETFSTFEPNLEDNVQRDKAVTDRAIETARRHKTSGQRYFNFVYYYSTHADYQHPEDDAPFQPGLGGRVNLSDPKLRSERTALNNRYKNSIHYVDREVGRLVDALGEIGSLQDTVIVFTGDHGEEFFEEGRLGHNSSLNKYQTKVPLVMYVPEHAPAVIERPTSHMDVFRTLLAVLGFPEDEMKDFQGYDIRSKEVSPVFVAMAHYQRPESYAIVAEASTTLIDMKDGFPKRQKTLDAKGVEIEASVSSDLHALALIKQLKQFRSP